WSAVGRSLTVAVLWHQPLTRNRDRQGAAYRKPRVQFCTTMMVLGCFASAPSIRVTYASESPVTEKCATPRDAPSAVLIATPEPRLTGGPYTCRVRVSNAWAISAESRAKTRYPSRLPGRCGTNVMVDCADITAVRASADAAYSMLRPGWLDPAR